MKRIDGTAIAQKVHEETRERVAALKALGLRPGLAVVLVGDDPASRTYVRAKDKKAAELGLHSLKYELPADTPQAKLLSLVRELNDDPLIHGVLVQSPLPDHIDEPAWSPPLILPRMLMVFTRLTWPSLPWMTQPGLFPARRAAACGFFKKVASKPPEPMQSWSVAA
jgi:hypothetical protein